MRSNTDIASSLRKHCAPFWFGNICAETKEAQRSCCHNSGTNSHCEVYDQGLDGSWEDMYKQESAVLTAKALCNLNIQRALYCQCRASHDSGKAWNSKDHYRDQYVDDTRAKDRYDCDCKQDVREAEQNDA